jgi:AhpD family alkylhydroperoxidase
VIGLPAPGGRGQSCRQGCFRRYSRDAQIRLRQQFLAWLANDPALLKRTWDGLKAVMSFEGALDPLVREMIYIAVSTANGCSYCVHSHTAAAKARGMTEAQHAELLSVIGLAAQTNHLVTAMQIPVDPEFNNTK